MGAKDSKLYVCSHCASVICPPPEPKSSETASKKGVISTTNEIYSSEDEKSSSSGSESSGSQASLSIELPPNTLLCQRCHAFHPQTAALKDVKTSSYAPADKRYIEHLHIAPFVDTLKMDEHKQIDSEHLINTYLKPYFSEYTDIILHRAQRIIIRGVEFKVLGCYPPSGYIDIDGLTQFHLNGTDAKLIQLTFEPLEKIHCLPIESSIDSFQKMHRIVFEHEDNDHSNKNLLQLSLKPYLQGSDAPFYSMNDDAEEDDGLHKNLNTKCLKRHLVEQETFVSHGISWRVMKCVPANGGYIDSKTEIFCDGAAVTDVKSITIRPIYESIPHSHRYFTPMQIKKYYLDPFFRGYNRYVDHTRAVDIFGVHFAIRDSSPNAGMVTMSTTIDYMGCSIKVKELESMQEMEDMELAQRLNREAEERHHMERVRLRRELRRGLRGSGWEDPLGFDVGFDFPWNRTQEQQQRHRKRNGVDKEIINRLPTFTFIENQNGNRSDQVDQCRICLEYYIDGDDLRILPCFHIYHKECVDTWLNKMSPKCPICKTSIIRQQRSRTQR